MTNRPSESTMRSLRAVVPKNIFPKLKRNFSSKNSNKKRKSSKRNCKNKLNVKKCRLLVKDHSVWSRKDSI